MNETYYDGIASGYDELHGEEQLKKLELIGQEICTDSVLKDFVKSNYVLLDVGCGTGISTGFFIVKEKFGVDPSKELIRFAIKNNPFATFKIGIAEKIPFKNDSFDIVVSLTAIQNFTDFSTGLNEIRRVGKKYFILTFLKKSSKHKLIEDLITQKFSVVKQIEENKDIIYFCVKK